MRRFPVRFIRPESFVHTRSSAGFTITTSGFKFSVHTRDVALWQLPQASACRHSTAIRSQAVDVSQHFVALGFPGSVGLSHEPLNITNAHAPGGFFKSDGQLEGGYSGGPV